MELNAGIRDLLATAVVYKQFPQFVADSNGGGTYQREQTTREYKPGRNFSVAVKLNL